MIEMSAADLLMKGLSQPPQQKLVKLAGTQLNILEWGDPTRPGLLFLHGGAAHVGWWRFIAPFFLPDYHCIAVDISGHGDSARRSEYTPVLWSEEVLALVHERSLFMDPPVIIGHSMGGLIGIRAAVVLAEELPGLVIIDSSVRPHQANHAGDGNTQKRRNGSNLLGQKRIYASRQQALARFRLIPPQPCKNEVLLEYIAAESIHQTDEGWTWKYDPDAFRDLQPVSIFDELKEIACPTAIIYGQRSRILDRETAENMRSEIRNAMDLIEIADAYHHIMLDQPVVLIEELKRILKCWKYGD
ncbi:3-oxoadipate enol-lactonase 2 [bacterium BMS3Bbin11]|nr:3-oxoadipate enol-lactonase 2 [bacterium BMS3Abin11]GBE45942.1 3-oxoadipate enol-lactonase 2 [bacterium BMS3Bbin11]GMT40677.1 MAG: alpha/beta hydrolase [bacterium]